MFKSSVPGEVRKVIADAITKLPNIAETHSANLSNVKSKVTPALAGWDKYAKPKKGENGYPCDQVEERNPREVC